VTRPAPPTLRGERVVLRPVTEADRDRLRAILVEPSVARWWGLPGLGDPTEEWVTLDEESVGFVVEVDGDIVGSIQFYEESDPDYRHAGLDLFLDTAHQGQGLGRDAIRTLARYVFEALDHHRLIIDPAAANEAAIRSYGAVGFRPVGVMRAYERGPDGTFHDGLLMDLLRHELR
jgi:aminoglycoside 6'-N-acetyltransferase